MKNRGSINGTLLAVFFVVLTVLVVGAFFAREWRPPVVSDHGKGIDHLITYLLVATGVFFVVGHAVLVWFLFRYREGRNEPYRAVSRKAEWISAIIPALAMTLIAEVGVFVLSMPVWSKVYGQSAEPPLVIEVVGKQFEWIVRYPGKDGKFGAVKPELVNDAHNPLGLDENDDSAQDDVVLRGTLHIPAGRPILIRLRSQDVIHSFSIPEFRVKQDVMPGTVNSTRFRVDKPGKYEIACAELCGLGHYRMRGFVIVHTPEDFEKWLSQQSGFFE